MNSPSLSFIRVDRHSVSDPAASYWSYSRNDSRQRLHLLARQSGAREERLASTVRRPQVSADALAKLTFSEKLMAGSMARGVAQTLLHPIDVVRTRLQAKGVARNWQPRVFAKGVIPQIVLAIPAGGLQFVAFEWCKAKLAALLLAPPAASTPSGGKSATAAGGDGKSAPARPLRQVLVDLISGAGGAWAASLVRVPQEVLKQRIQADIYPDIGAALPAILRSEGIAGLYRGYWATVSRDVPWNALSFLFFLQEARLFERVQHRAPTQRENLVLAALGGTAAAVIMTPVDVVKTRLMTQKQGDAYRNILHAFQRIVSEEGAGTLMRGVVPRVMFLAPLAGITLSIYNAVGGMLLQRRIAHQRAMHLRPGHWVRARACHRGQRQPARSPAAYSLCAH